MSISLDESGRIVPAEGRPDWFKVSYDILPIVGMAPSVWFDSEGEAYIHRTHLPLIRGTIPISSMQLVNDAIPSIPSGDPLWVWRSHQVEGYQFALQRRGTLLAFEQRLGKSPVACALHDHNRGPLVVISPKNVLREWKKQLNRFFPDAKIIYLSHRDYISERDAMKTADVVFCHEEILPSYQGMAGMKIGTLILDEVHRLSNSRSLRGQAIMLIAPRAEKIVGLSGTPLWNKPEGLFSILNAMAPGAWGKWWNFSIRYASASRDHHGFKTGLPSNIEEFQARLTEVMIKKSWNDVAPQLPKTQRFVELIPTTKSQDHEIDIEMATISSKSGNQSSSGTIAARLASFRKIVARFKIDRAVEISTKWAKDEEEPVVIWTWHRDIANELATKLLLHHRPVFAVTGETSSANRDRILDDWEKWANGILVISLGVGQVGIDLSKASKALFVELDWTPSVLGQAEMRTFSLARPMSTTYLVLDHVVERTLADVLKQKFDVAKLVGIPSSDGTLESLGSLFGIHDKGDLDRLRMAILCTGTE